MSRGPKPHAELKQIKAIALAEMVDVASGKRGALAQRASRLALRLPAYVLARSLVSLDKDLARYPLRRASISRLQRYGALPRVEGPGLRLSSVSIATAPVPARGPLLVIANHPGLYDALALFAAIAREDLKIIAAERPLLAALPHVQKRLLAIHDADSIEVGRPHNALALRRAVKHLASDGALLHFPAGRIEPDPAVTPTGPLLHEWRPGLGSLIRLALRARPDLRVVCMAVSGVLSPRARSIARVLGRDDSATDAIVPLIQLTFPGFGADVRVHTGPLFQAAELAAAADPVAALRGSLAKLVDGARSPLSPHP